MKSFYKLLWMHKMKIFLLFIILVSSLKLEAQQDVVASKHLNLNNDNVAVQGYDLVTYFEQNPQKGNKSSFVYSYKNVLYYFVSQKNKEIFIKNPVKYLPAYGGWCAYAMGDTGKKVEIDPETYKIVDGKLYLFYNKYFTNTLKYWNEDEKNLKEKANINWLKIIK